MRHMLIGGLSLLLAACGGGGGGGSSSGGGGGGGGGGPAPTSADAARLLTQASFGPTDTEITKVTNLGINGWID
ncbi:MAG: hypothetical protein ABI740_01570, partial [Alphaproteobacteria bacterium]